MFDILVSADAYVPDHAVAMRMVADELGIPAVSDRHIVRAPEQRTMWSFAKVHRDRRVAPTMLEILGPMEAPPGTPFPGDYDFIPEIAAAQGDRPARLHSTVVGVTDVYALAERFAGLGLPYRLNEPTDFLPLPRLWLGFGADRPGVYQPEADGGLHLEFLPSKWLGLPEPEALGDVDVPDDRPVRIVARTLLVADLDETLRRLEHNVGWSPSGETFRTDDGVRRCRLVPGYPRSAVIELLEAGPGATGPEAELAQRFGPGAYGIRFGVRSLAVTRERLRELRVPVRDVDPVDGPRLYRPADRALGAAFEFVEDPVIA